MDSHPPKPPTDLSDTVRALLRAQGVPLATDAASGHGRALAERFAAHRALAELAPALLDPFARQEPADG